MERSEKHMASLSSALNNNSNPTGEGVPFLKTKVPGEFAKFEISLYDIL